MEAGYLNATARLNSSASTLASISVTGGSTLAGTLQLTGASTFAVRPVEPPPDAVLAHSTRINLTNNTTLALQWTFQDFATNSSIHSTATNPERFTPQSTGIHLITGHISLSGNLSASTGNVLVTVEDSSGAFLARDLAYGGAGMQDENALNVMTLKRFDTLGSTPWVRLVAQARDGSTMSCSTRSWGSITKL